MIDKLHFFGFSVTRYGNPSFVDSFRSKNLNIGSVTFSAMGGISFEVLPYMVDSMLPPILDCLVLEVGTSYYALGKYSPDQVDDILFRLVHELHGRGIRKVIFLMLPRQDLPVPCMIMGSLIRNQERLGYGVLDLQSAFRDSWSEYGVDTVHPTKIGIEFIADELSQYLADELVQSLELKTVLEQSTKSGLMVLADTLDRRDYPLLIDFESSSLHFTFPQLELGERLEVSFDHGGSVEGMLYLMGPDSGTLAIRSDENEITLRTYDQHCYYYRFGFRAFNWNIIPGQKIHLESMAERDNTKLIRPTRYKTNRILNYPIAFAYKIN